MLEWKDVTDTFSEEERHWQGRYLELDEVADDKIECSLYCHDGETFISGTIIDVMPG